MKKMQDQRVRITKKLIRESFMLLLEQKPIQSITIKELCTKAGINRSTFYAHFEDVYDLRDQMEEDMLHTFREALGPLLDMPSSSVTPLDITTKMFQCIKDNSDLCKVTLGPFGDKNFLLKLLNIAKEHCVEGYIHYFTNASPSQIEYYYAFVSNGCIGLLQKWLDDGMTVPAAAIARMAEGIMLQGIGFLQ